MLYAWCIVVTQDPEDQMSDRPLRVGVVGANAQRAWAHDAHIPALKRLPQFTLAAVSARTQALADEAAAAFGAARAFGDSLALVRDPQIDLVAVTVKVPEHRAIVLAALETGKHVYCEWPLGRDLAEAEEMAAAVTPRSHVMIGVQAVSAPAVRQAAKLVREGALGRLEVLRVFSPTAGWGPEAPPHYAYLQDRRNGATLETIAGGHTLAAIEAVVGPYAEVDARTSILRRTVKIMGSDETVERTCADHMLVLGRHETGCVSTLEVAGGAAARALSFELIGEKGSLRITSGAAAGGFQVGALRLETDFESEPAPAAVLADAKGPPVNVAEAYARFAGDIRTGTRTVPDFDAAVRLTRLLDRIDAASASGRRQSLA
jgi:predicted dehydrogenase